MNFEIKITDIEIPLDSEINSFDEFFENYLQINFKIPVTYFPKID